MVSLKKWQNKFFRLSLFFPFIYWAYLIFFGDLGAQPAQRLNHLTGKFSLYYFLANLWLGVLLSYKLKWPRWLLFLPQERRWLGVVNFIIICCHIFLYFTLEAFEPKALEQIYTKTYLIFGALAFLIFLLLAATSNNISVRLLGLVRWKWFHRSAYLAAVLVTFHIFLIEKADLILFAALTVPMWLGQIFRIVRHKKTKLAS